MGLTRWTPDFGSLPPLAPFAGSAFLPAHLQALLAGASRTVGEGSGWFPFPGVVGFRGHGLGQAGEHRRKLPLHGFESLPEVEGPFQLFERGQHHESVGR